MNEQKKIERFINKCREKNLSVTPQRLSIYKILMKDPSHPNPESIYKKVREENPTISFATVYKTLETFEKHGLIAVLTNLHNTVRYDPVTEQHHHIICVKCKKVVDLFDDDLNQIKIPESVTLSNKLIDFSVHFNVICSDCKKK